MANSDQAYFKYHESHKQVSYLFGIVRTRPIHLGRFASENVQYKVEFEPWLGTPFFRGLSHGSENLQSHGSWTPFFEVWAMARDPFFGGFEPWLRAPFLGGFEPWLGSTFFGGLSHGSGPHFWGVWAMAQDPSIFWFEPWLRKTMFLPNLTQNKVVR